METDKGLSYHQHYYNALLEYDPAVFGTWSKLFEKKTAIFFTEEP